MPVANGRYLAGGLRFALQVQARLAIIEDTIRASVLEMEMIKTHLAPLGQLCSMLEIPFTTSNGYAVPA